MSKEKRIEQEINWYKVVSTILIATIQVIGGVFVSQHAVHKSPTIRVLRL